MPTLIATVAGDVLGSTYEFANYSGRPKDLTFFPKDSFATDDTILTCAVAEALLVARRPDGSINEREFSAVLPDTLRCFARRRPVCRMDQSHWRPRLPQSRKWLCDAGVALCTCYG